MLYHAKQFKRDIRWAGLLERDGEPIVQPTDSEIDKFSQQLNGHLDGNYGLQEFYGISWDGAGNQVLSRDSCARIMQELGETLQIPRTEISYSHVDSLPEGALYDFARECEGGPAAVSNSRRAQYKIAAQRGNDLAGFITHTPWRDVFSAQGLFVEEAYRGQRIGTELVYRVIQHAHEEGLRGVDMDNMSIDGEMVFHAVARRYGEGDPAFSADIFEEDFRIMGRFRFEH